MVLAVLSRTSSYWYVPILYRELVTPNLHEIGEIFVCTNFASWTLSGDLPKAPGVQQFVVCCIT